MKVLWHMWCLRLVGNALSHPHFKNIWPCWWHSMGINFGGIVASLQFHLGENTVSIKVEVVDVPLDYNLLLGRNWMYSMQDVASSLFQVIWFLFNGKIVMIDQNSFHNLSVNASSGAFIPIIDYLETTTKNVGLECILRLWEPLIFLRPFLWLGIVLVGLHPHWIQ